MKSMHELNSKIILLDLSNQVKITDDLNSHCHYIFWNVETFGHFYDCR